MSKLVENSQLNLTPFTIQNIAGKDEQYLNHSHILRYMNKNVHLVTEIISEIIHFLQYLYIEICHIYSMLCTELL